MTRPRSVLVDPAPEETDPWRAILAQQRRERAADLQRANQVALAVYHERERLRRRRRANLGAKAVEKVTHRVRI